MTVGGRIYWVTAPAAHRLAVVTRPRGADSYRALKAAGIDVLVSLLEADEAHLVGLGQATGLAAAAGIEHIQLPVTDHGIPSSVEEVARVVRHLGSRLADGMGVGAHCYAGLGRSPLLVASVLIGLGHDHETAIELVSQARGCLVPEMESQHAWLAAFAGRLGR